MTTKCQPRLDTTRLRCHYATDPQRRPDCQLTPTLRIGTVLLCPGCHARSSTLGKGQSPQPIQAPAVDVLAWIAAAQADLHAAAHTLDAAVSRARQNRHSWQTIAARLGISRQAAQQRFRQPRTESRST